PKPPDRG
nr:RecName: Full=Unknown protein from 2D-PAGE of fibroblasts; AltName: Full=P46 [Mus musculus]